MPRLSLFVRVNNGSSNNRSNRHLKAKNRISYDLEH
jgi:hypothetical protein